MLLDDATDGVRVRGIGEAGSGLAVVEHSGDFRERFKMLLVVGFWNEKENNEGDGNMVDGLEIDTLPGAPEDGDDRIEPRDEGVRNGNAGSDAGAGLILAVPDRFHGGFDRDIPEASGFGKVIDEFLEGVEVVGRLHVVEDLIHGEHAYRGWMAESGAVRASVVMNGELGGGKQDGCLGREC